MKKSLLLTILIIAAFIVGCESTGGSGGGAAAVPKEPTTIITLSAKDAELVTTARLVYEEAADRDNVGWWTTTDDQIKWKLEIKEEGEYTVFAKVACDPQFPGSTVNVTVSDKTFSFKVPNTESWSTYISIECGKLNLKPGTYPVLVQAAKVADRFVCNLNSIRVQK